MKNFNLILNSKNERTLNTIFATLAGKNDLYRVLSIKTKKKKEQLLSILKSPHVNKTAQEQFQFLSLKKKMAINSAKSTIFLFLMKNCIETSFNDLTLKTKFLIKSTLMPNFNPDKSHYKLISGTFQKPLYSLNLSNQRIVQKRKKKRTLPQFLHPIKFLKQLDLFGETKKIRSI